MEGRKGRTILQKVARRSQNAAQRKLPRAERCRGDVA